MNNIHDIRVQLEVILANHPDNDSLKATIEHLSQLEREGSSSKSARSTWLELVSELKDLQGQGLWGTTEDQKRLLDSTSRALETFNTPKGPDFSIIMPQSSRTAAKVHIPTLPPELLGQINEVYLLHGLANHPSKVLPPGKSLLSVFSSRSRHTDSAASQKLSTLKDHVSEVVTRAFWDEAFESLSSPTPAIHLSRLRLLYTDLCTVVTPLIPSSHPILHTLSHPLSPTSSPLRSASGHLTVLLSVLRERCAPIRDAEIDSLLQLLVDVRLDELPRVCTDVIRGIFDVAERMKDDLADLVIGTWTERDAQSWIRRKAVESERRVVLEMFPPQMVMASYLDWLGSGTEESIGSVIPRLMKVLGSSEPVSPFPPSNNVLPAPFIFTAFDLLKAQNLLQALIITASLRTLVRTTDDADTSWLSRIWALLELEVDRSGMEPTETKLLNLEDEVVQAARSSGENDAQAEDRLREAVRRTLRPLDPVFVLLQSRLLMAIQSRLMERGATSIQPHVQMRSGRGLQMETREARPQEGVLLVRGFEDAVLQENVKSVLGILRECLEWMDAVWGEFLRGGAT